MIIFMIIISLCQYWSVFTFNAVYRTGWFIMIYWYWSEWRAGGLSRHVWVSKSRRNITRRINSVLAPIPLGLLRKLWVYVLLLSSYFQLCHLKLCLMFRVFICVHVCCINHFLILLLVMTKLKIHNIFLANGSQTIDVRSIFLPILNPGL